MVKMMRIRRIMVAMVVLISAAKIVEDDQENAEDDHEDEHEDDENEDEAMED